MSYSPEPTMLLDNKQGAIVESENNGIQLNSHTDVSSISLPLHRQTSHASTVFNPDYRSNDCNDDELLRRAVTNVSTFSDYSNVGPVNLRQRLRILYYENYGALLVLLAQLFGSIMNASARLLEQPGAHGAPMHPFQILFARQTLTAFLCTFHALVTKSIPDFPLGPPDRKVRLLLMSRGLCGFFGIFGIYFSLLYLPLSEATVLTFLVPILTCYLCSLVLPGETFTRQQVMAGIVSFIGVIFIAHPETLFSSSSSPPTTPGIDGNLAQGNGTAALHSDPLGDHDPTHPTPGQHLLAIGIAMIGVCGGTGALTSIRAIGTRAHALISINYFSIWSAIVSLAALMIYPDVSFRLPGNMIEWGLLLTLCVSGFILQILLTMGLAYGGPGNDTDQRAIAIDNSSATDRIYLGNKATGEDIEMQTQKLSPLPTSSSARILDSDPSTHRPDPVCTQSRSQSRPRKLQPNPRPSGNRATSMVYSQMLFALIADRLIFGTTLGVWSWIGSGLILSGAIWVAAAKDDPKAKKTQYSCVSTVNDRQEDRDINNNPHPHYRMLSRRESIPLGDSLVTPRTLSREHKGGVLDFGRKTFLRTKSTLASEEQVGLLGENGQDGHEDEDSAEAEWTSGSGSSSSSPVSSSSDVSVVVPLQTRP